jgi:uncharacterized FlaG/YvyC family protein
MQIGSITHLIEVQSAELKLRGNPAVGKAGIRQPETQEPLPKNSPEQTEKFRELQAALAEQNITLDFSRDDETNEIVVRLIDDKTGEELQQFPSEVSLKLAAVFARLQGQFVDEKI